MRMFLVAVTGFLVGGAVIAALALIPLSSSNASSPYAYGNHMSSASMSSGMMSSVARPARANAQTVRLTIQHVQRGCHVWSNGRTTGATMRLHLRQGGMLSIMDMDVDPHQMMQFAGPMHLRMGGPMMTAHGMKMTFTKKGTYRFGTRPVEMPGMADVKTIGPDNKLRLVVTVA